MEIGEKTCKDEIGSKILMVTTAAAIEETKLSTITRPATPTTTRSAESSAVACITATKPAFLAVEIDAVNSKLTTTTASFTSSNTTNLPKLDSLHQAPLNPSAIIAETISISDDEAAPSLPPVMATDGKTKKRKIIGPETNDKEQYKLKRRKIKVAGAPKMPLTGYVRYMNDRRESLKKEHPDKTSIERTKLIGEEWNQLSEEKKAPYMKAAEIDKQRYLTELHTFLKARPDVLACELAKNKSRKVPPGNIPGDGFPASKDKSQTNGNIAEFKGVMNQYAKQFTRDDLSITSSTNKSRPAIHTRRLSVNYALPAYPIKESPPPIPSAPPAITAPTAVATCKRTPTPTQNNHNNATPSFSTSLPGEIPIFTNEFLEHNKIFDMELRTLRKSKADLEQQNAVLEKHVENMKFGVEKMASENDELQEKNRLLEIYLEKLKRKLANALSGLAIPTEPQGATVENIDKYMNDLYKMATSNSHGPASLNKAKDIIRKLDLQIQL